jgi:hypothetical protein
MISLHQNYETRMQTAKPNIQIVSVKGSKFHQFNDDKGTTDLIVDATVKLENRGVAPAQIISIQVEPIEIGYFNSTEVDNQVFAISDQGFISDDEISNLYGSNYDPMIGISNPTFKAREKRTFYVNFRRTAIDKPNVRKDVPTLKITFTLSTGEDISVLPEIEYSGGIW